ncbi:hypothetical protein ACFFRR_000407 [Megaselia abdita]
MTATMWLWSALAFICFGPFSCVRTEIQDGQKEFLQDYPNSYFAQDGNFLLEEKRTKPSLSIVNPLDVLRQRLLLEIARRQFNENTRQIEKNRDILKSVGKRRGKNDIFDYDTKNLLLRTDPGETVNIDGDIEQQHSRNLYDNPKITTAENEDFNERRNLKKYLYSRLNEKQFNGF